MRRIVPFLLLLALAACGEEDPAAAPAKAPVVVATTTQAADLAGNVMCNRSAGASCAFGPRGILESSADPHDYELRPDDIAELAEADLIIRSGGEVDEWLDEAIESAGSDAPVVDLLAAAGGEDPHWWTDPKGAMKAVAAIRDALVEASPGHGEVWRTSASQYLSALEALDGAIDRCMERIAPERRKIVTTHDALGRFAGRYDIEVVGTVIPSRSTQGQASSGQVAALVRDIEDAGAVAVFSEAYVSRDVERAIVEQAGATLGKPLQLDALGPDDDYLSATAKNAAALAEGMSGGKVKCSLPS